MDIPIFKKKHYLGFWTEFHNLDLSIIFKKRDRDWNANHDYCVYMWKHNNRVHYIGKGKFQMEFWQDARPFIHKHDTLAYTLDSSWTCMILAWGLTDKEARILEAKLIGLNERKFSKTGTYKWDGESLINKRRELTYKGVSYEVLFEEYLNLDNGNNYWETFRREVNGY